MSSIASLPSISCEIINFTQNWIMRTESNPLTQRLLCRAASDPIACLNMISDIIMEEQQQLMPNECTFVNDVNDVNEVKIAEKSVSVSTEVEIIKASIAPLDIKSLKNNESSTEEKSSDNSSRKEEKSSSNENKDDKTSWAAVASVVTTVPLSAQPSAPSPSPSGSSLSSVKSNKSAKSVTSAASSSNSGKSNTYVNVFVDTVIDDEVEERNISGVATEQNGGYHVINDINMFMKSVLYNTDIKIDTVYLYLTIINMPNESGRGLFFSNTTMFKETILPAFQANEIKVHGFNEDHEFYTDIKQYIDRILVEKDGIFRRKINAKLYITSKFLTMCSKHFY